MLSPERLDRIHVAFNNHRLVAKVGPLPPVTLAGRLGPSGLVNNHMTWEIRQVKRIRGDKMLTLMAFALTDGNCRGTSRLGS